MHRLDLSTLCTMTTISSLVLLLVVTCSVPTECARILCFFLVPSKSHSVVFTSLTRELASRGHELVVVSPYPLDTPPANYTDIDIMPSIQREYQEILRVDMYSYSSLPSFLTPVFFWNNSINILEQIMDCYQVRELLYDNRGFDLVLAEDFLIESSNSFAEYFKAPLVVMSAIRGFHWDNYGVGNPLELAYVPNSMLTFTDKMNFWERLENTVFTLTWDLGNRLYQLPRQEKIRRKMFGSNTTSLYSAQVRPSLVLVNNHFSLNYPRPLMPSMVEVGGMHVSSTTNKLPLDLQTFLDEATEGVIYFSMGSNLRSDQLPAQTLRHFLNAFSKIPQRVLWKWESESLPGQPRNVKLAKWLPQQDILAHPKVRAFISHGGLMSMQESIYHGVPLLGVPIFGDQMLNVKRAVQSGYAVLLTLDNVTTSSLLWAIDKVTHDLSIRHEAARHSAMFRDQPQPPLARAVYWLEYVLRHEGAPQLRSAALELTWYERNLLDVAAAILGVLLLVAGLILLSLNWCLTYLTTCVRTALADNTKKIQ